MYVRPNKSKADACSWVAALPCKACSDGSALYRKDVDHGGARAPAYPPWFLAHRGGKARCEPVVERECDSEICWRRESSVCSISKDLFVRVGVACQRVFRERQSHACAWSLRTGVSATYVFVSSTRAASSKRCEPCARGLYAERVGKGGWAARKMP